MIVTMFTHATQAQISAVVNAIERQGLSAHLIHGAERTVIVMVGDASHLAADEFRSLPGVESLTAITHPYKLASRDTMPANSVFQVCQVTFGGPEVAFIAGPCSVESRQQMLEIAHAIREAGGQMLRGGAFKPRSSPYSFQGMGEAGLELLAEARAATGLPVVTEVMAPEQVPLVTRYADMLQIGARNMQNYNLLHAVGESQHPVLLKRGMSATIEELLMSAEYILSHGNRRVALCERGIRTYETATRNTTDINAIPVLKSLTHLPVLLDPSHSTGQRSYVAAIARAAVAAGADGLIIEVHPDPDHALSDGGQSLRPEQYAELVQQARKVAAVVGRS